MKPVKAVALTLLLLVSTLSLYARECQATASIQIISVTPFDRWGNANFVLDAGLQTNLTIVLDSSTNGQFLVSASVFDTSSTPVGHVEDNFSLQNGTNTVALYLNVSSYAFVGLGHLHVVVSGLNQVPLASTDVTIYIGILGDFDGDNKVNFDDLTFFANGYVYYRCNSTLSSEYKICDITGNGQIDFDDLCGLAIGYVVYHDAIAKQN